jgi:hypothetical protein
MFIVLGEQHLRHLLKSYQNYYNEVRTHLSLSKDAPVSRAVQAVGDVVVKPLLGGLHHQYLIFGRDSQSERVEGDNHCPLSGADAGTSLILRRSRRKLGDQVQR